MSRRATPAGCPLAPRPRIPAVGNRFWNGGTTHWGISWKQCIYESNVATGVSTTAMGSNYPQYAHNDGAPHVQHIYHFNNSQNMVWGNDREMMTCDGGGGVYYGTATAPLGSTTVTLSSPASGPQPGGALCVLNGTGTGECRRVLGNRPAGKPGLALAVPLSLVPCGGGALGLALRLKLNATAGGDNLVVAANASLVVTTWCDPPGRPSGSTQCGAQPNPEPLVLAVADEWARQYQTDLFTWQPSTGSLQLAKSGKCVVADDMGAVTLVACAAETASQWALGANGTFSSVSDPGQCIGLSSKHLPGDLAKFSIDRPFTTALDATSNVTILPYIGNIAFNGNNYSDGGEVQFYAQAFSVVAAENRFTRTGGLSAWARGYSGKDANLGNSFVDNTVLEGNHVWNYNTQPNPSQDPSMYPYFPGGSKTVEPWFFASLTNEQGPPVDPHDDGFRGAFNRFIVFRGNTVNSNGGIVVRGTSANVLVEGNTIRDSSVAIHVNYTTTRGGIIVSNNDVPADVPDNYNPYA